MKLKKINDISLTAKDIKIGDVIPVNSKFLKIDKIPENLEKAFEKFRSNSTQYLNEPFIFQHKITMSPTLFVQLYSFTKGIKELFPNIVCKDYSCLDFYIENPTANFSEVFENHLFRSAEFAIMAQLYLQSIGADSEYVAGQYLRHAKDNVGYLISFILIHENDKDFVFDPLNNDGTMPNISVVELTPKQKVSIEAKLLTGERKVAFFETRNIITDQKAFYGYGDGRNVSEDMVFGKEATIPNVPVKDLSRS